MLIAFVFWGDGSEKLMTFSVLILFRKHNVCDAKKYTKTIAQLILDCPLLSNLQSNLHGKWPMAQKFLATPFIDCVVNLWEFVISFFFHYISHSSCDINKQAKWDI